MLNERQFIQYYYDRSKSELEILEHEHVVALATYKAQKEAARNNMEIFRMRLSQLDQIEEDLKNVK